MDLDSTSTAKQRPWVRVEDLDLIRKKAIMNSTGIDFMVVSRDAYTPYGKFAEARATLLARAHNRYQQFWDGPYSKIAEAVQYLARNPELTLAVSSAELREFAAAELESQKFAPLFTANALWGLVECGIIDSALLFDEAEHPKIDPQFRYSSSHLLCVSSHAPAQHEDWAGNLTAAIENLQIEIGRLTQRLSTMQSISQGIDRFGGWETFKECYGEKLKQHISQSLSV